VRELAAELPRLQGLTAVALECARLGRSANGALQAMRVWIVEDALCLFGLEANAAASLQAGLMALPPAAVAAHGGGALELLETFMMHARRAVALQRWPTTSPAPSRPRVWTLSSSGAGCGHRASSATTAATATAAVAAVTRSSGRFSRLCRR
jgi:hypothetical protein